MKESRVMMRAGALAVFFATLCLTLAPSAQAGCGRDRIATVDGCQPPRTVSAKLASIVNQVKRQNHLRAVIGRVDVGHRTLLRRGFGRSQAGAKARPLQRFRLGSMTIPALSTAIFRFQDRGRLRVTDRLSRWFPGLPGADRITLLMLMNNSSGYRDWIQGNQDFIDRLYADPFRTWGEGELLRIALDRGSACEPASCFNYAHTNYLILGRVLRKVTGSTTARHLWRRIYRPLGMTGIHTSRFPGGGRLLNSFTRERGVFENATGWSPSWTLGNGQISTGTVDDVVRGARGIFSGRLLKPRSRRTMIRSIAPMPEGTPPGTYFAQGLIVSDGWRLQNPYLNGYMGGMAWLPKRRIAIGLVSTRGRNAPVDDDRNFSNEILTGIASYLTPGRVPRI